MYGMWAFGVYQVMRVVLIPKAEGIYLLLESTCLVGGLIGSFSTAVPHSVKVNQNKFLAIIFFPQNNPL